MVRAEVSVCTPGLAMESLHAAQIVDGRLVDPRAHRMPVIAPAGYGPSGTG